MEWSVSDDVDDDVMALPGPAIVGPLLFLQGEILFSKKILQKLHRHDTHTADREELFFVIATRSLRRRMPASPRGVRIRAGMSKSVNEAESSTSMCSLYSSYLSNEESIVGVCIIMRKVKKRGEPPPRQVKPIKPRRN